MALFTWRNFVGIFLASILPVSLSGQDQGRATLEGERGVEVNGAGGQTLWTLFPGDNVETHAEAHTRIQLAGATVDLAAETVIQFASEVIQLNQGSVTVHTSRGLGVRAGCLVVTPVNLEWTLYDVANIDGRVTVAARKKDVSIDSRSPTIQQIKPSAGSAKVIVHEGKQESREQNCGAGPARSAPVAANGPILTSPPVVAIVGSVIVAGTICLVVLCFNDALISPSKPKQ